MNGATYEDAFNLLCGKLLGEGIHRKVFECRLRDDLVVKVESEENWRYFARRTHLATAQGFTYTGAVGASRTSARLPE